MVENSNLPEVIEGEVISPADAPMLAVEQIRKIVGEMGLEGDQMETLEAAWDTLTREDRELVAQIPFYATIRELADAVGRKTETIERKMQRNPAFRYAVRHARSVRGAMLQRIAFDHLGRSMIELGKLATDDAGDAPNKRVKLEAIKHLHLVTGITEQAGGVKVNVKGKNVYVDQRKITIGY